MINSYIIWKSYDLFLLFPKNKDEGSNWLAK